MAREFAKTEAYRTSRRQRKKVEMPISPGETETFANFWQARSSCHPGLCSISISPMFRCLCWGQVLSTAPCAFARPLRVSPISREYPPHRRQGSFAHGRAALIGDGMLAGHGSTNARSDTGAAPTRAVHCALAYSLTPDRRTGSHALLTASWCCCSGIICSGSVRVLSSRRRREGTSRKRLQPRGREYRSGAQGRSSR
jgi:hypothetical protein